MTAKQALLICIPCLNEAATIGRVIGEVPATLPGIDTIQILVIDDGSTDATSEVAIAAGAEVIRHDTNLGLGTSFGHGVQVALDRRADFFVNIDGDGQFFAGDIGKLLTPLLADKADMVTASRFKDRALEPEMPAVKRWGNTQIARLVRLMTGQKFEDVTCGFRAYSRETLLHLNLFGSFTYTQEAFLDLAFKGKRIIEVPIRVRGTREFGKSRMANSIPKYALRSFKIMFRTFISYRPLVFFMTLSAIFLAICAGLLGFLVVHYIKTSAFSPHIWSGFLGGSFVFLGSITSALGLLGDMLVRIRLNQENIIYQLKSMRGQSDTPGLPGSPGSPGSSGSPDTFI